MSLPKRSRISETDGLLDYVEDENVEGDGGIDPRMTRLRGVQVALDILDKQTDEEMHAVERRMYQLYQPIYRQRAEAVRDIPDFYRDIFANQPVLATELTDTDLDILRYVVDMEAESFLYQYPSASIKLVFRENPYFSNVELTKSYTLTEARVLELSPTPVVWKDARQEHERDSVGDSAGQKRRRHEYSFFDWFADATAPPDNDYTNDPVCMAILDLWKEPVKYYFYPGAPVEIADEVVAADSYTENDAPDDVLPEESTAATWDEGTTGETVGDNETTGEDAELLEETPSHIMAATEWDEGSEETAADGQENLAEVDDVEAGDYAGGVADEYDGNADEAGQFDALDDGDEAPELVDIGEGQRNLAAGASGSAYANYEITEDVMEYAYPDANGAEAFDAEPIVEEPEEFDPDTLVMGDVDIEVDWEGGGGSAGLGTKLGTKVDIAV